MSVSVQNLSKQYPGKLAVDNISFELKNGEITGFIGPNGAGKSTTIKMINGYISQSNGNVSINGIDMLQKPVEARKFIGYLPENNPLYPSMYVKEYLFFISELYQIKNKKSKVDEMIQLTGLTSEYKKKIGSLSKGYKQRVGLSAALIHDPSILVLDEPTSGLDPNQIIEIRELIRNLGQSKTVLMSTHLMQEVEAICDRILLISNGKLVADDSPEKLKMNPGKQPQTILVEFDQNPIASELEKIEHVNEVIQIQGKWLIETDTDQDIRPLIFRFAVDHGITILSQQKIERKLEDVFRELTNQSNEKINSK